MIATIRIALSLAIIYFVYAQYGGLLAVALLILTVAIEWIVYALKGFSSSFDRYDS
jgi:hypothetical protein